MGDRQFIANHSVHGIQPVLVYIILAAATQTPDSETLRADYDRSTDRQGMGVIADQNLLNMHSCMLRSGINKPRIELSIARIRSETRSHAVQFAPPIDLTDAQL